MIALNYIYLSKNHAGGKDQVGINLLKGFSKNNYSDKLLIICYQHSEQLLKAIAPSAEFLILKPHSGSELKRIIGLYIDNSITIPKLLKKRSVGVLFHLSINNGFFRYKTNTVLIPHDIKQVAHRRLGKDKIPFYKYLYYKLVYDMDFRHADKIIAISDSDKEEIRQYYPEYFDKVQRIYNPVDVPMCHKKLENITEQYLLAINLQFHHKNIITLIKAYELIRTKIPQKLILVGSVPKRVSYLKEYVKSHQLEEDVIFMGFLEDKDKYALLSHTALYINPTKFEGFGLTAVEAMMLKVPVLVSDIPVNREVTKGRCEYYEPAEDERKLAEKILYCLNKKQDINKLSENKKIMEEEYSFINISKIYMDMLEEMDRV